MKSMKKADFESRCYEAYKLDWMISHGYSLKYYLYELIQTEEEARATGTYPEGDTEKVFETLNDSFEERGFGSGSLWACKDEFLESEFQDEAYMEHLFSMMPNSKEMEDFWRVFYNKSRTIRPAIEVSTSAGVLRAYEAIDPGQPGINIALCPAGYAEEIKVSSVSVCEDTAHAIARPVDVVVVSYGDPINEDDEDFPTKEIIRREDVIAVFDDGSSGSSVK